MTSQKIITANFLTPVGELILGSFDDKLCIADWRYRKMRSSIDNRIQKELSTYFVEGTSQIIDKTKQQLTEYFNQERKEFTIPLLLLGTTFQKSVWSQLIQIPFGETNSYLELSKKIDNAKAIRAVASANGANAVSILVPCHRIIGSDGELVGYAGGLKAKEKLLHLEGALHSEQLSLF